MEAAHSISSTVTFLGHIVVSRFKLASREVSQLGPLPDPAVMTRRTRVLLQQSELLLALHSIGKVTERSVFTTSSPFHAWQPSCASMRTLPVEDRSSSPLWISGWYRTSVCFSEHRFTRRLSDSHSHPIRVVVVQSQPSRPT